MNKIKQILLAALLIGITSCYEQPEPIHRKYIVRLSNSIGSEYYECDTVIRISENRIQLKVNEDSTYFVDITVPVGVVVRIYPNK